MSEDVRLRSTEGAYFLTISSGWLATMKMPLLTESDFDQRDAFPGAAIVNRLL